MRLGLLAIILALSGCLSTTEGQPIPEDKLYFPSILLKNNNTLYVVNANEDQQYRSGSISQIDVSNIDQPKILHTYIIPSMAGQAIFSPDGSTIYTTSQQTNSNSLVNGFTGVTLPLPFNAPYFIQQGLMAYLTPATNELWDASRFSIVADQAELQAYSVDPTSGNFQITKSYPIASCFPAPAKNYRRIARVGGLRVATKNTYILAEFYIDDPKDVAKFLRHVFLIQTVPSDTLCNKQSTIIDITQAEQAQGARALAVSEDEKFAYVLLDEGPLLVTVDLTSNSVTARTPTCKGPTTLKLSPMPTQNTLLVSCSKSNELTAYDTLRLDLFGNILAKNETGGPLTGGPQDILFDAPPSQKIYVSYQQDHKVGIFEYANSAPDNRSLSFKQWLKLSR